MRIDLGSISLLKRLFVSEKISGKNWWDYTHITLYNHDNVKTREECSLTLTICTFNVVSGDRLLIIHTLQLPSGNLQIALHRVHNKHSQENIL